MKSNREIYSEAVKYSFDRWEEMKPLLAEFIQYYKTTFDYSRGAPVMIEGALQNSSDDVKRLIVRMFWTHRLNVTNIVVDKRKWIKRKRVALGYTHTNEGICVAAFYLEERVQRKEGMIWKIIENFETVEETEDELHMIKTIFEDMKDYE